MPSALGQPQQVRRELAQQEEGRATPVGVDLHYAQPRPCHLAPESPVCCEGDTWTPERDRTRPGGRHCSWCSLLSGPVQREAEEPGAGDGRLLGS